MKKTGPTNQSLNKLIYELRSSDQPIWKRVAKELTKARRKRRQANLYHIGRSLRAGESALVPGTVLGTGELNQKTTVIAWKFTNSAIEKIKNSGSRAVKLGDYYKTYKSGSKLRIIG